MSASFSVHGVHRIEVSAYSAPLASQQGDNRMHCQSLALYDERDVEIGRVVLFLADPDAALKVGDRSGLDNRFVLAEDIPY